MFNCILLLLSLMVSTARGQEESHPQQNSPEFEKSYEEATKLLLKKNFGEDLASPSLGSASSDAYAKAIQVITSTWKTLPTTLGKKNEIYDVILQAGHYGRPPAPGKVGTQGKAVSEQQLAAYLVRRIEQDLSAKYKLKVLILSADEYSPGLKAKLFLAIHADGSEKPCATGPSLSYQKNNSTLAMHAIGWALSQALGYRYDQFRKDGFTANAAHYYMFSQVDAPLMKGLLEVGELTCPEVEERLVMGADSIATNIARAISFIHEAANSSGTVTKP
jgi:N-acetylmuramoyl-L-alanine amidase